ncbi:MAG: hypothetical protein KDC98_21650 [Planctomycetes bacterium]|nr:hypothetical protein [Planctomycetota bacterium]
MWLAIAVLAACAGTALAARSAVPAAFRELLPAGELRVHSLSAEGGELALGDSGRLVLATEGWQVPDLQLGDAAVAGLRQFVAAGGRLLLLGYAAALACRLGIEDEHPELEPFRWGFDARTAIGSAQLGIEITTGQSPELFDGLVPAAGAEFTHYLAGGAPCCVPLCVWNVGAPSKGSVLARLGTEIDGIPSSGGPPVLVRWTLGKGQVFALGLVPELENGNATIAGNARRLLRNLLALANDGSGEAVMIHVPAARPPALPDLAADFAAREVPMHPLLAHWGWSASIAPAGDRDRLRDVDDIIDEVLVPSWIRGADLLELEACHPDRGLPLVWPEQDTMRRPEGYRGDAFQGAFDATAFGQIANEAHGRGMLVQAFLDPLPFGEQANERLASLRFVARQLACVRRLGARALDGFGVRRWLVDGGGYSRAMVQDINPAAFLYGAGEQFPSVAGSLRALDAEDGALRGLAASGLSSRWRDGFPRELCSLGVLDARVERALPSRAGPTRGGGSYGDWIVTQANDFVRARQADGAALWWRTHDGETLGRLGAAYVQGISLDPLRAAVAMQLAATGENGYRAAAAKLVRAAPAGFGAELPVQAAVHVLQNNWFRLVGSGGGLLFDPRGEARFRPGQGLTMSPCFLRTRLFGGRPDAGVVKSIDLDLLLAGSRPEGGYDRTAVVGKGSGLGKAVPAMLAFDDQPRWPQRTQIELSLDPGYYELEIAPRAVRGRGILVTGVDGTVVDCRAFVAGDRAGIAAIPLHVARDGVRLVELAVAEGGTVAIDHLRLVRRGDVAAEGKVEIAAGYLAEVDERSSSSYHSDQVELRTIGDFPGFLLRIRCMRAARNLRVERQFTLPAYVELVASGGADPNQLRTPFVLRSSEPAWPDLVVVPIQLARYEHLRFAAGEVVLHSSPAAGAECRVSFWIAPHGCGAEMLPQAAAVFRGLDQPVTLDLGDRGEGVLVSDLPLPWTRVVRVQNNAPTPYLVRENGWWTWRGAQPAKDGGDWLRVCQLPGDTVEIVGGASVLARTRPGKGSLHVMALREPLADSVNVRVLQRSRLVTPSVIMAADFDEVRVDGQPWSWFDGRTVFLPDRPGDYRVETSAHGGDPAPHVLGTQAPLLRCHYDASRRELVLQCDNDPALPAELPFTAVLRGPVPTAIDNGEIVAEDELPHADADARARAAAAGVLIRFLPGLTKVHYED